MATVTFDVQMDENTKKEFDAVCEDLGISASDAFNLFAEAVVRERKIPFEIKEREQKLLAKQYSEEEKEIARKQAREAFWAIREEVQRKGTPEMTMEEIDEEIRKARYGEN